MPSAASSAKGRSPAALETAGRLDLAGNRLDYEGLRRRARDPHLSANEKMGFAPWHRDDNEPAIFADILAKLPALRDSGRVVVDIGPGCGALARLLIEHCAAHRHRLVLVDSPEMLALLPERAGILKLAGRYPGNAAAVGAAAGGMADAVLCYSVLHVICLDDEPFAAVDAVTALLAPGGSALFGDIPNRSKRQRFLASAAGAEFRRRGIAAGLPPEPADASGAGGGIDDALLAALAERAHAAGC